MKAGRTDVEVGSKVLLTKMSDDLQHLEGQTGIINHPSPGLIGADPHCVASIVIDGGGGGEMVRVNVHSDDEFLVVEPPSAFDIEPLSDMESSDMKRYTVLGRFAKSERPFVKFVEAATPSMARRSVEDAFDSAVRIFSIKYGWRGVSEDYVSSFTDRALNGLNAF